MGTLEWQKLDVGEKNGEEYDYWISYDYCSMSRDEQTIICAGYYETFITMDGGETWRNVINPNDMVTGSGQGVFAGNNGFVLLLADSYDTNTCATLKYNWENDAWDTMHEVSRDTFYSGYSVVGNEDGEHCITTYWCNYDNHQAYVSHDYGESWTNVSSLSGLPAVWSLDINKSGNRMVAGVYANPGTGIENQWTGIYVSTNYGDSWIKVWHKSLGGEDSLGSITSISTDDSGQHIVAFFYHSRYLITSSDYGSTWVDKEVDSSLEMAGIHPSNICDVSADGSRIVFANYYSAVVDIHSNGVWVSSDFGISWTEVFPGCLPGYEQRLDDWIAIYFHGESNTTISAISERDFEGGDEETSIVHPLCTSHDFGETWTYTAPYADLFLKTWWLLSTNENGNTILAADRYGDSKRPYISFDRGLNWEIVGQSEFLPDSLSYRSCEISSSGQYMILSEYSDARTFVSDDYGESWSEADLGTMPSSPRSYPDWSTTSGDGSCMTAGYRYSSDGYQYKYFLSFDYGLTWEEASGLPNSSLLGIKINDDGSLIVAITSSEVYYLGRKGYPIDTEGQFINITGYIKMQLSLSSINPSSITMSESGQYIYISTSSSPSSNIIYSHDGLLTWETIDPNILNRANDTACSYSGGGVFFSDYYATNGEIFISNDYGESWETFDSSIFIEEFLSIVTNGLGEFLVGADGNNVYIGIVKGISRIKSIAGVPFESILKVIKISKANLKAISRIDKE